MKVGEVLLHKAFINKAQLKEALDAQLSYGGHLGTCLMELGYVTEKTLGHVLAEVLGVGYAPRESFENIPPHVTACLSERLVDRYQAIPFQLQDRLLDVALVAPKDLLALDEIAFATGFKLRAWVAPEARIFQAMERYYDIPRRLRYVTLCREIDRSAEIEVLGDRFGPDAMVQAVRATGADADTPVIIPMAETPVEIAARPAWTSARVSVADAPVEASDPLTPIARELMAAETVDRVCELVLGQAAHQLERSIVFLVRAGKAHPWKARGLSADQGRWASLSFTVTSEPLFALLAGDDLYHGPIPSEPDYRRFFDHFEMPMPIEGLVISAHVDDRLVALFYGDCGPKGSIRGDDEQFRRLAKKLGLALHMVQLRRSILSA